MPLLDILNHTRPELRARAEPVEKVTEEIRRLIRDMRETMKAAPGIGLAAPQVGVLKQVIVVDTGEPGCAVVLVNPKVIGAEGESTGVEGCLSIPGIQGLVTRPDRIAVRGLDARGKKVTVKAEGLFARVIQHEIDHLYGILFIDRALPGSLQMVTVASQATDGERLATAVG
jgi:peptide deformylase